MEDLRTVHNRPIDTPFDDTHERADWEDWEDEEPTTPMTTKDDSLAGLSSPNTTPNASPSRSRDTKRALRAEQRASKARQSAHKIQRPKSRKRQQAQNAKAGITVVTDMTALRRGPQHVAQLVKPNHTPIDARECKFVDANALRALEGEPSSASVGNWAWLKKKTGKDGKQKASKNSPVSPAPPSGNKIVIGISMAEEDAADRLISPQTAVVATPMDRLPANQPPLPSRQQMESTWSPDTEDGCSPSNYSRAASSIYSQANGHLAAPVDAPPVPVVPSYFSKLKAKVSRNEVDDDDNFTPVTLFEEDGGKSSPLSAVSKVSAGPSQTRSGWWDHVKTPFTKERFSPLDAKSKSPKEPSPAADEWWKGKDEKTAFSQPPRDFTPEPATFLQAVAPSPVPIIRLPTPTPSSSSRSSPRIPESRPETHAEKARVMEEENDFPTELPPTYEQASKQAPVRYRAVFPPGHALASQFPPSPGPVSPGLSGTMTSQGAISMTDVPLTPGLAPPMHDRPVGSYVTGEHFASARGDSPQARIERQRRRHEKEDVLARKAGGFWKGRGCLPDSGCYGRSGREGRKRRRVYLFSCLAFFLLVVLGVVLGVILSRRVITHTPVESIWLNLTDFPPTPTGVFTVVGPDDAETVVGCTSPTTLWSCSLPPEQQDANAPYAADQPKFIFQIQYDNNTRQLWNIPNGVPPTPTGTATTATSTSVTQTSTSVSATSTNSIDQGLTSTKNDTEGDDTSLSKRSDILYDTGFAPNPEPPSFAEMWFLGNTSDGIVSDEKAGEPTPFYISFFRTLNETAGANMVQKRGTGNGISSGNTTTNPLEELLPAPILNADGTGAAAQLRPYPYQQPLRLFDRGLPTEHYGFYSYYNKTIYAQSINASSDGTSTSSSDKNGGSLQTESKYYGTWAQTRFVVKIFTRLENSTRLLGGAATSAPSTTSSSGAITTSATGTNDTMPGTFPYPITIGLDTHGGDRDSKASFLYGVEPDLHINTTDPFLIANLQSFGGSRINPSYDPDMSYGGVDGGDGGCKCSWMNYLNVNSNTAG